MRLTVSLLMLRQLGIGKHLLPLVPIGFFETEVLNPASLHYQPIRLRFLFSLLQNSSDEVAETMRFHWFILTYGNLRKIMLSLDGPAGVLGDRY